MANFNWLKQWSDNGRKMGHSVFDLSKKMCFHLPNSMIVPIRFIETVPDDHFQIDISGIMRSETMNKAAFYQGKAVFSAFFVPYKQLWHNFNQFVVEKVDKHSNRFRDSACAPNIELAVLLRFVCLQYWYEVKDEFGYPAFYNSARLLQYAKIFNLYPFFDTIKNLADDVATVSDFTAALNITFINKFKGRYVNLWRLLAYQHIFYDFYRNKYYDDNPFFVNEGNALEYIDTFNVDSVACSDVASSHFTIALGSYGETGYIEETDAKLANILNVHYCQYRKDLYTSLLPSTQFGAVSGLEIDPNFGTLTGRQNLGNTEVNNQYQYLNGDDLDPVGVVSSEDFMIGADSMLYDSNREIDIFHTHPVMAQKNAILSAIKSGILPSSFDVLSLRRAELLQQWKQNALRAGNMVDQNFESHYGVKPYYEDDNNVRFLGQFECRLDVNPVTATADSSGGVNSAVGDIAAYGVGSVAGQSIDVQIKDFGVIVVCAHMQSEVYYSANGIDKQNTLIEPFDYFQSEFENAGLDSVSAWQQSVGIMDNDVLDMSFGFTPPYTMYKTEVDEVFGEYGDCSLHNGEDLNTSWNGSLSAWTVRRSDLLVDDGGSGDYYTTVLPLNRFYQSPKLTDSIFGINYDAKGDTDPFGFAVNIAVKAIRPMSVLGIPIFG